MSNSITMVQLFGTYKPIINRTDAVKRQQVRDRRLDDRLLYMISNVPFCCALERNCRSLLCVQAHQSQVNV